MTKPKTQSKVPVPRLGPRIYGKDGRLMTRSGTDNSMYSAYTEEVFDVTRRIRVNARDSAGQAGNCRVFSTGVVEGDFEDHGVPIRAQIYMQTPDLDSAGGAVNVIRVKTGVMAGIPWIDSNDNVVSSGEILLYNRETTITPTNNPKFVLVGDTNVDKIRDAGYILQTGIVSTNQDSIEYMRMEMTNTVGDSLIDSSLYNFEVLIRLRVTFRRMVRAKDNISTFSIWAPSISEPVTNWSLARWSWYDVWAFVNKVGKVSQAVYSAFNPGQLAITRLPRDDPGIMARVKTYVRGGRIAKEQEQPENPDQTNTDFPVPLN